MLDFIIEVIIWVLCIYGFFSLIQDYINYNTAKKVQENIKFVMTVKNVENGIEEYIRELSFGRNFYNSFVIIDLDSEDGTMPILRKLEKEKYNMKVMEKDEGIEYLKNMASL